MLKLEDYRDNCALKVELMPKNLTITPESYGVMMHYAFDPETLKSRPNFQITRVTLVIDVGYDTTDVSVFEGVKYQRDLSFTLPNAGIGVIARAVRDYIKTMEHEADVSRIDAGMRRLAGVKPGAPKKLEFAPDQFVNVAELYDVRLANLARKITDEIETQLRTSISRALLTGGGAYHPERHMKDMLGSGNVFRSENPDHANVIGAMTAQHLKEAQGR